MSWETLFAMDPAGFHGLSREPGVKVPVPDRLGYEHRLSPIHLFYNQAAAACLYLFAGEDGKYRERLMDYVGAWYRGEAPTVREVFGLSPGDLGKRTVAFAKHFVADER